jgi:hypothetical protein
MLKSEENIFPQHLSLNMELPVPPIASPGKYRLV